MLDINEFSKTLKDEIEKIIGMYNYVEIRKIMKNNSKEYTAMTIYEKNDLKTDDKVMAPTYYAEDYYDEYSMGMPVVAIAKKITVHYNNLVYPDVVDVETITRENLEQNLFYKLINKGKNSTILKECPYITFLDLAVTFHYMCGMGKTEIRSFRVTNDLADRWNMTSMDLFDLAQKNMHVLFPDIINTMQEILFRNMPETECEELLYCEDDMYVLTNSYGMNGASAILYSDRMHELAITLESDLYILPSSIHEVLLVPEKKKYDLKELYKLVEEVNETVVKPEEILADNVYFYSRDNKRILSCI